MKNKTSQSKRQRTEIQLYRVLCIELIKVTTAAGIKLPKHVMMVVKTCFPNADKVDASNLIKETFTGSRSGDVAINLKRNDGYSGKKCKGLSNGA